MKKLKLWDTLFFIIYFFIFSLLTYLMKRDDVGYTIFMLSSFMKSQYRIYIIISCSITFIIFIIIKSIMGDNLKTEITASTLLLIITIVSYYKYKAIGVPFLPSDVLLIKNIFQISTFGLTLPKIIIILFILILIVLLVLHFLLREKLGDKFSKNEKSFKTEWYRIPLLVVGMILLYFLCISPERFDRFSIKSDLGDTYSWMGGNAVFFMHLGDLVTIPPKGYNQTTIENIKNEEEKKQETTSKTPNVILIMNEAYSNPNYIRNITYTKDPMQEIEKLITTERNCKMGNTISPVLGGGTSLPEFEALTGLSSYFLNKQIFPYTAYIRSDMNSIVRVYANNGYKTIGIHTNTKNFYNRKNVYPYLGFEETVFEEDIKEPEIKAGKIADNELANQIIQKFEITNGKKFIFGVSMQNHMPYTNKRYENYDIDIQSSNLTESSKKTLQNYVQGVYDANKMYMKLVNYLKQRQEPTILIMFGDHLPSLLNYSLYKQSNYMKIDYYKTPYIVWANYDINVNKIPDYVSPSYLSIQILESCNIDLPWYLKKFKTLYMNYPVFNNTLVVDKNGRIIEPKAMKDYDFINDCRILQYDLLIKKKYIEVK